MDHHKPHARSVFEGYYSKFDLRSGAHLALVCCQVRGAISKPYMLSFTYVPTDVAKTYQREVWVTKMHMVAKDDGFIIDVPGLGYVRWFKDRTEYEFKHAEFSFKATANSRTPWSRRVDTPESWLVHLPLPLHWHVYSLASECDFSLKIADYKLDSRDTSGGAKVHEEKNWANSFPSAHMWLQARAGDRAFCCAGGQILGMEAFLLGYRTKDIEIDFRPPFALRFAGLSPFLSYSHNWEDRTFELTVQGFRQKLVVKATAPKGTFFSLSSPFPEGHRENYLGQSFQATLDIKIYESGWLTNWRLIREDRFENASLEYGAGYYPPAGSSQRFH